uniref:TBC1 domain family member 17-like isoform X1 n=1 Tax=Rhizophora mucronata TaxID=61149 RepID=A0A2P2P1X4_RHIMU
MHRLHLQEELSWESKDHSFLDSSQHLYLSRHKQLEYPKVLTSVVASHKTPTSCLCESHQDLFGVG